MNDDIYELAGNVAVPEEKREEFNRYILQILHRGGIRKTEQVRIGGKEVTVISHPVPDQEGIVRFDYSIFEKKKREAGTYNTNTCELIVPDRGYQEFGVVMNLILTMQEAYSQGQCYLLYEGKPCYMDGYVAVIQKLLGIDLDFSHRANLWDMLLFLKNTEGYRDITAQTIWDTYSFDLCPFNREQFIAAYGIDSDEITAPEEPFNEGKDDIGEVPTGKLKYYVYQVMRQLMEKKQEKGLIPFLRELLDADLPARKTLAEDTLYGIIAEVSLYVLPSVIVHAYAVAVQREFWEVWKELGIKGYSKIMADKRIRGDGFAEEGRMVLPFYKAIRRKDEDEFMEFWGEETPHFSEDMKECLSDWRERFQKIDLESDFDLEDFLAQIVVDLDVEWGCRLVDKSFVTEFTEHRNEDNYKKALLLYREFMDEDTAYFPELTKKQAIRWIIRNNRYRFDFTAMSAFQSLLIDHEHRLEILGF